MQLGLTPDVLFPLVAGVAVAISVIVVIVVLARGKRPAVDDAPAPTAADWTGEAATGDPLAAAGRPATVPVPAPRTVAHVVAGREADTAPLPMLSSAYLAARPIEAVPTAVPESGHVDPVQPASGETGHQAAGAEPVTADPGAPDAVAGAVPDQPAGPEAPATGGPAAPDLVATGPEPTDPAASPVHPDPVAEPVSSDPDEDAGPPSARVEPPSVPAPQPAGSPAGSSRTVAAAVAQALAARAAAGREPVGATEPPEGPSADDDARDRLLGVLLDNPSRAVGAAVALEACKVRLEQLTGAVDAERRFLGETLGRLAGSGLRPDQLARLAGLPVDEVHGLLDAAPSPPPG